MMEPTPTPVNTPRFMFPSANYLSIDVTHADHGEVAMLSAAPLLVRHCTQHPLDDTPEIDQARLK